MPNIKSYYPTLSEWEKEVGTIPTWIYKDLNLERWESRVFLFARIVTTSALEKDPRPKLRDWIKGFTYGTAKDFSEDLSIHLSAKEMKTINELSAEKGSFVLPLELIPIVREAYLEKYPESLVVKTKVGKFVETFSPIPELGGFIQSYCSSVIKEIEWVYSTCVKAKEKGEDYTQINFDWRGLSEKIVNSEKLQSLHNDLYQGDLLECLENWKTTEFILGPLFIRLIQEFQINNQMLSTCFIHSTGQLNIALSDGDHHVFPDCEVYIEFTKSFGKLWGNS